MGPYNSKTGGRTTKKFLLNLLRVVKNDLVQTFFYLIFLLPVTKFCPLAKNCRDPKFLPNFFFSLNPPLSEFKVKIRGHPFAYRCYSSNWTTILLPACEWYSNYIRMSKFYPLYAKHFLTMINNWVYNTHILVLLLY